jgi:hypothetical protein
LVECANDDLAGEIEGDGGDTRDGDEFQGVVVDFGDGETVFDVVGGTAEDEGDHDLGSVIDDECKTAESEAPPVAAEVGKERSEVREHF